MLIFLDHSVRKVALEFHRANSYTVTSLESIIGRGESVLCN